MAEKHRGRTARGILTVIAALATALSMTAPVAAAPAPQTVVPAVLRAAVPLAIAPMWVAASDSSMAVLGKNGRIYTWGSNTYGQLGNGTKGTSSSTPVAVKTGAAKGVKFTAIAAGYDFSLALGSDGRVYAWGGNTSGQLGIGKKNKGTSTPVPVKAGATKGVAITAIAAGLVSALALGRDGHVYAWGLNDSGQLGDGTRTDRTTPVRVLDGAAGDTPFEAIAAGDYHSIALGANGRAYSWGNNFIGSLGTGDRANSSAPVLVSEGAATHVKYTAIAANNYYTIALGDNGAVYHWGERGIASQTSYVPQRLSSGALGSSRPIQLAAGYVSAIVLANNNHVYTIGSGEYGQLGNGKTKGSSKRVVVKDKKIPLKGIAKKVAASRR